MTFDELQNNWKCQQNEFELKIQPDILLREVQRNQKNFETTYFWCDIIITGCCMFCAALFLFWGIKFGLWPLYLLAIICFSVSSFVVINRIVQRKNRPGYSETLHDFVNGSLIQVKQQIWIHRNVFWWFAGPIAIGQIIWFGYWKSILNVTIAVLIALGVHLSLQWEIRKKLNPRKQELEELLNSLKENNT